MTEPLTRLAAQQPRSEALKFAADLLRSDLELPPVDPRPLERARRRLRREDRELRPAWRPAIAVGALALSSLATAAVLHWTPMWPLLRPHEATVNVPPRLEPPLPRAGEGWGEGKTPAPAPTPVERTPGPRLPARRAPPPVATRAETPPPAPETEPSPVAGGGLAAPEGPLAGEAALLGEALRALNVRREPLASLGALDAYDLRYPAGALRREALVARIDALLALGRREEALELLEKAGELRALPKGRELEVLRGELRARAGDCRRAAADFEDVLGARDPLSERALWGLAVCGSRPDLERYLREYPNGTFAPQARAALRP
jgi:hypothetical protein